MNATDKQTLAVLKTFTGLLSSEGAAPVLLGMFSGVMTACRAASDAAAEEIALAMHTMAAKPAYRDAMKRESVSQFLVSAWLRICL